jgi:hypothetical protein
MSSGFAGSDGDAAFPIHAFAEDCEEVWEFASHSQMQSYWEPIDVE